MLPRVGAVLLGLLLVAVVGACGSDTTVMTGESVEYGSPAPALDGITIAQKDVSSSTLSGNPVIITFWATTCAPCKRELPMLQEVKKEHADKNLEVLAINAAETPDQIEQFFDEIDVDLPVLIDDDGELISRFEVLFLPMTYFIDEDWILRYRTVGEPSEKQLAHGLNEILGS